MAGIQLSGLFLTFYLNFNFLASLFAMNGYIDSSALSTVLRVVLLNVVRFLLL